MLITLVILSLLVIACLGIIVWQINLNRRLSDRAEAADREKAATQVEAATLRERIANLEASQATRAEEDERRFKLLAANILDDNSRRLSEQAGASLAQLIAPLNTRLEEFKKTVTEAYSSEARERFSLEKSLRELMEANKSIGREAKELTEALRGNSKTQGDWGEMILEQLLEKSGLRKSEHFLVQTGTNLDGSPLKDDDGHRLRPDVVMLYPDNRCVVVDSKVSLSAYVDYVNAETEEDRTAAGRRHLTSIRTHIAELADKSYQDFVGDKRLDFAVMFVPNEGAYMAAMQLNPDVWQEAYDRRVLIASPTHLISILRMIEQLWKQDAINRNVERIATESGAMLEKFQRFLKEMANIEKNLARASDAYQAAFAHLKTGKGNLINRATKLVKLGAKGKNLDSFLALTESDGSDEPDMSDDPDQSDESL